MTATSKAMLSWEEQNPDCHLHNQKIARVWNLSNSLLDSRALLATLKTGQLTQMSPSIQELLSQENPALAQARATLLGTYGVAST